MLQFEVNGEQVEVDDDGANLLEVLRERLGLHSLKDGCSPQGQCGCCTVLVDGQPRVACVTPARRIRGRNITTLEGLGDEERAGWADAFCSSGASQCGFCTPGIIMRLQGLHTKGAARDDLPAVEQALLAHLCRCTGWRTILDAWQSFEPAPEAQTRARDSGAGSAQRAEIEGGTAQLVSPEVALGLGGFADDTAPAGALVAVSDGSGGWSVGETLMEARERSGKVQGRRTTDDVRPPLELPPGNWDATLRTSWVEPAYLELDASWCTPGGEPTSPLANGGAFGGKTASIVQQAARNLADEHGRVVRVLLSREDSVRLGPKRPPIAAGARSDGTGLLRVVRTPGYVDAVRSVAPGIEVEEIDVSRPTTSMAFRATGWGEALILLAAAQHQPGDEIEIHSPSGGTARARVELEPEPLVRVTVSCGRSLDETVLSSYCTGAAHMALGWVCSEGLAVDEHGDPHDLTIRSFGILRAVDTPRIEVNIENDNGSPVNGSDAVFVAVAAATWIAQATQWGTLPTDWPTGLRLR